MYKLITDKKPKGDQPKAIEELVSNFLFKNKKEQILLGATGTGKTFTIANVIKELNKPTLVLAPNKTLANQIYIELKGLFPENRVEFFTSSFDYYRPEAYMPKSDTYIEKKSKSSNTIETMRLSAMHALTTRQDVIVVSSVASIYGLRDPKVFQEMHYEVRVGEEIDRDEFLISLVRLGYKRTPGSVQPGSFRVHGDHIEVGPSWTEEWFIKVDMWGSNVESINKVGTLNNEIREKYNAFSFAPANESVFEPWRMEHALKEIKKALENRLITLRNENKELEAQRLEQRVNFDMEQLEQNGYVNGIENYAIYFEDRILGQAPATLMDYFSNDFITIIDESHLAVPQINGMYEGDRSRKQNLVDYGFRLPSALENRPLKFNEWYKKLDKTIYVSATPGKFELEKELSIVQQIIRPTGLLDPVVEVRNTEYQLDDIINEIQTRKDKNERVIVNTMTIKMSEDVSTFLKDKGISTAYIHSELKPIERFEVLRRLREGKYDVIVGINLLREGIDLPEVSLVAILDADKEGFMRNSDSLIQLIGRAARNSHGKVIMYATNKTKSMMQAIEETNRRREIQKEFNIKNNIIPKTIVKPIPSSLIDDKVMNAAIKHSISKKQIEILKNEMNEAAKNMNFEKAIQIRDLIIEAESTKRR